MKNKKTLPGKNHWRRSLFMDGDFDYYLKLKSLYNARGWAAALERLLLMMEKESKTEPAAATRRNVWQSLVKAYGKKGAEAVIQELREQHRRQPAFLDELTRVKTSKQPTS